MFEAPGSKYLVPYDGSFEVAKSRTSPPKIDHKKCAKRLRKARRRLDKMQQVLYADNRLSVLLVFQAMDAAGKDSTIRAVMQGINPAGCQVFSFKKPSSLELDHDYLWRTAARMPERGRIGIFNRSYYEEILVVRVHPKLLEYQRLPRDTNYETIWDERLESILDHEKHLARNGTVILKFWLNVSREEQRNRFLARINKDHKQWKYEPQDYAERQHWDKYMQAYEAALATSRPWAPWYAIPADDKPYMRATVARLFSQAMQTLDLRYPVPSEEKMAKIRKAKVLLETNHQQ
ncbi:MAG: polyphosphate kinase 2 family protein [Gammaproteobacteria bacterium]|nr:polyphosphate kinase 2 family protein [Gammaproteobacteria bacterium]